MHKTLFVAIAVFVSACVSENPTTSYRDEQQMREELREELRRLGTNMCDLGAANTSIGTSADTFNDEFEGNWGCSGDVYWYQFVHQENGRSFAWSQNIDRLNDSVRLLHEKGQIKRIVSGPNLDPKDREPELLPSYLADKYKPGAIPPDMDLRRYDADSIENTLWIAIDTNDQSAEYHFLPEGRLRIRSGGSNRDNSSWQQDGNTVFIEINDRYVEMYGLVDENTIDGNAWNKTGGRWTWSATRLDHAGSKSDSKQKLGSAGMAFEQLLEIFNAEHYPRPESYTSCEELIAALESMDIEITSITSDEVTVTLPNGGKLSYRVSSLDCVANSLNRE